MSKVSEHVEKLYIKIKTRYGMIYAWDKYPNTGYHLSGTLGGIAGSRLHYQQIPFNIEVSVDKNGVGTYLFEKIDFAYPYIKPLSNNDSFPKTDLRKINKGLMEDFNNWAVENPQIIKEYAKRARQREIDTEQDVVQYHYDEIADTQAKIAKIQKDIDENFS